MIYIVQLTICDKCGKQHVETIDASLYSDPVINLPDGWSDADTKDIEELCPQCIDEAGRGRK